MGISYNRVWAGFSPALPTMLGVHQKFQLTAGSAILSDNISYTEDEIKEAKKRFRALYISELSMVESKMKDLAKSITPDLLLFTDAQLAADHNTPLRSVLWSAEFKHYILKKSDSISMT